MLEERTWYCGFVAAYSKSLEIESSMYTEVDRLNTSLQDLEAAITQPTELPDIAKEFIEVRLSAATSSVYHTWGWLGDPADIDLLFHVRVCAPEYHCYEQVPLTTIECFFFLLIREILTLQINGNQI